MATQSTVRERSADKVSQPRQYNVIMLNDDFTTMEFVVSVLTEVFHKSSADAERIMLFVHKNGKAVVGRYPYDIAVTRVHAATQRAKDAGFPFRILLSEE